MNYLIFSLKGLRNIWFLKVQGWYLDNFFSNINFVKFGGFRFQSSLVAFICWSSK